MDGSMCFAKDAYYAQCRPSCTPGIHEDDVPGQRTPWSCTVLSPEPSVTPATTPSPAMPVSTPVPALAVDPTTCPGGPGLWESCQDSRCCTDGSMCFEKHAYYAQCRPSCTPGIHSEEEPEQQTPWSCQVLSPVAPTPAPVPVDPSWMTGTYTTGYWDCCKPSCSWPGKGKLRKPVLSCDASTGNVLSDANVASVCGNGGTATSCSSNQPFVVTSNLSMGFAAAAVSGSHGLTGEENCGQCFELRFTGQTHTGNWGNFGGAHPDVVGKRMIVQVTNIGHDVNGEHSFDIQIPGSGQGTFTSGCTAQFPGYSSGDFDCDVNYGGCDIATGCDRLPAQLQPGCRWKFDWFRWLAKDGKTVNPYVDFRRVQCPQQLIDISGTAPEDDAAYPVPVVDSGRVHYQN